MAFDIYVGSLSKYYSGSWENRIQQHAKENGLTYDIIRPQINATADNTYQVNYQEIIRQWLQSLSDKLNVDFSHLDKNQESYFTERLDDFDILYFSNCSLYIEDVSSIFTKDGQKKIEKKIEKENIFIHLGKIDMWIPINLNGSGIYTVDFNQEEKTFATTSKLIEEINKISLSFFDCQISALQNLNIIDKEKECLKNDLIKLYSGANFSIKHNLIMFLDY